MTVDRRRLLKTLTCAGGMSSIAATAVDVQGTALTTDIVRSASVLNGSNLSDGRLAVAKAAWERRLTPLQAVRNFEVDDSVGLTVKL
jgi:hypothetical protein